jgi:hypothetical protein
MIRWRWQLHPFIAIPTAISYSDADYGIPAVFSRPWRNLWRFYGFEYHCYTANVPSSLLLRSILVRDPTSPRLPSWILWSDKLMA